MGVLDISYLQGGFLMEPNKRIPQTHWDINTVIQCKVCEEKIGDGARYATYQFVNSQIKTARNAKPMPRFTQPSYSLCRKCEDKIGWQSIPEKKAVYVTHGGMV